MDPSKTSQSRIPLGDLTNIAAHGIKVGDPNARKSQRDKQQYASMTMEQRNERNRKRRERRAEKNKAPDNLDAPIAAQAGEHNEPFMHVDGFVPEDEDDENSEWLHRGNWNQNMECLRVGTHIQAKYSLIRAPFKD